MTLYLSSVPLVNDFVRLPQLRRGGTNVNTVVRPKSRGQEPCLDSRILSIQSDGVSSDSISPKTAS